MNATIHKAESFNSAVIKSASIYISKKFPSTDSLTELEKIYKSDADDICNVLFATLPQGTIDQILIKMLSKKRSLISRQIKRVKVDMP